MTIKNQEITLQSTALPNNPLVVQKLCGEERMSGLFRFELDLICDDPELPFGTANCSSARTATSRSRMLPLIPLGACTLDRRPSASKLATSGRSSPVASGDGGFCQSLPL